jgi:hypothetical protein
LARRLDSTQPWVEQPDEKEREAVRKAKELIEQLKAKTKGKLD